MLFQKSTSFVKVLINHHLANSSPAVSTTGDHLKTLLTNAFIYYRCEVKFPPAVFTIGDFFYSFNSVSPTFEAICLLLPLNPLSLSLYML